MHTCISSHGLKRSWCSCPRRVNAGNKNTPSTHHPWRRNVTTLMVGLKSKTVTYAKISPKSGEPQRYSWGTQKKNKNTHTKTSTQKKTPPYSEISPPPPTLLKKKSVPFPIQLLLNALQSCFFQPEAAAILDSLGQLHVANALHSFIYSTIIWAV